MGESLKSAENKSLDASQGDGQLLFWFCVHGDKDVALVPVSGAFKQPGDVFEIVYECPECRRLVKFSLPRRGLADVVTALASFNKVDYSR